MKIQLSQLDEARFGVRSARASEVGESEVSAMVDFCTRERVVFLVARCSASDLGAAQGMERAGFRLMDTLVYCARKVGDVSLPPDQPNALIRPLATGEEERVRAIAAESFRGYFGHYHADPRLDRTACDETYVSWAERSCTSREVAGEVLVADMKGQVEGFITLRLNDESDAEAVIGGVTSVAQGQGIYRSFIIRSMQWARDAGRQRLLVSTQITNLAVQKVWARLGFEPIAAYYTFHKWFDEDPAG